MYKRQGLTGQHRLGPLGPVGHRLEPDAVEVHPAGVPVVAVSYTHLRAHETVLDLVCRLLLEKKKNKLQVNRHRTLM